MPYRNESRPRFLPTFHQWKSREGKDATESELIVKAYSKATNLGSRLQLIIKLDLKKLVPRFSAWSVLLVIFTLSKSHCLSDDGNDPIPTRRFAPWFFKILTITMLVAVILFNFSYELLHPSLGPFYHSNIRINLSRKLAEKSFYATSICRSSLLMSLWSHHYYLFRASLCSGEGISMHTSDDEMSINEGMYPYRWAITVCKPNPFLTLGCLVFPYFFRLAFQAS